MKRILLVLFLFLTLSCSEDDFSQYSELDELRVIAMVFDQPQIIDSGSTTNVQVTPYVSDINGGGRVIAVEVFACAEPLIDRGEAPTCDGRSDRVQVSNFSFNPATAGTGMAAPHFTGDLTPITITVPANLTQGRSATDQFNGVGYMVEMVFTAGSENVKSIARIDVSQNPSVNTNPSIENVLQNGQALLPSTPYPSTAIDLVTTATAASSETYNFVTNNSNTVTLTEELSVSYLTSRGEFNFSQILAGQTTTFTPDTSTSTPAIIVIVLRDDRGGSDVQTFTF